MRMRAIDYAYRKGRLLNMADVLRAGCYDVRALAQVLSSTKRRRQLHLMRIDEGHARDKHRDVAYKIIAV